MKPKDKPAQNEPQQAKKNSEAESWLKLNLGLQHLGYEFEAHLWRMSYTASSYGTWIMAYCLMLLDHQSEDENGLKANLRSVSSVIIPILLTEMILYAMPKSKFSKFMNGWLGGEQEWALHLQLIGELNEGKFMPFMAEDKEHYQFVLELLGLLGHATENVKKTFNYLNYGGFTLGGVLASITWLKSQITPIFLINHLLLVTNYLINSHRQYQHPSARSLLTEQESTEAIEKMLKVLHANQLAALSSKVSRIRKPNNLCFILEYETLSSKNLFKLLTTDLIIARITEGKKHYLAISIPIDKIKSEKYEVYLKQLLEKATQGANAIEWGLDHLKPLPLGWLAPLVHQDHYYYLLVEEQYFQGLEHFQKDKYVLENGYYKISLLDKNNRSTAREIKSDLYIKSTPIKKIVVPAPDNSSNDTSSQSKFYGDVVSHKLLAPIYKKSKKCNITAEISSPGTAPQPVREIDWDLPKESPFLIAANYSLLPVETTHGNRVVNSHLWVVIPTTQVQQFRKYLFLLGDEWNGGNGIKRFEAQQQDTGCYKTHDKSDQRYLLVPTQLGTYISGSANESRPMLLRLHTEQAFSHEELKRGIPNEQLKNEMIDYEQRYAANKKNLKN